MQGRLSTRLTMHKSWKAHLENTDDSNHDLHAVFPSRRKLWRRGVGL
jgi:hypothetical protein